MRTQLSLARESFDAILGRTDKRQVDLDGHSFRFDAASVLFRDVVFELKVLAKRLGTVNALYPPLEKKRCRT
jgi:hypothetical protein